MEKENPYQNEIKIDQPTTIEVITGDNRYFIYVANGAITISSHMESMILAPRGGNRVTVTIGEVQS